VLLEAIREGLRLLTWSQDSFAYAETFDEEAQRYRGLRCGEMVNVSEEYLSGLLVRPEIARKQHEAEKARASGTAAEAAASTTTAAVPVGGASESSEQQRSEQASAVSRDCQSRSGPRRPRRRPYRR
jgi:hypothetical protein